MYPYLIVWRIVGGFFILCLKCKIRIMNIFFFIFCVLGNPCESHQTAPCHVSWNKTVAKKLLHKQFWFQSYQKRQLRKWLASSAFGLAVHWEVSTNDVTVEYRFVYGFSAKTVHYTFTIFSGDIGSPVKIPLLYNHVGSQLCQNFRGWYLSLFLFSWVLL